MAPKFLASTPVSRRAKRRPRRQRKIPRKIMPTKQQGLLETKVNHPNWVDVDISENGDALESSGFPNCPSVSRLNDDNRGGE